MPKDTNWYGKPYYSLNAYFKNTYGRKCYKVALNAHMTCPNRDGSKGVGGCIFCSEGGSGDFAVSAGGNIDAVSQEYLQYAEDIDMVAQLDEGIRLIRHKLGKDTLSPAFPCVIAYFQAYTNTYAPVPYLKQIFSQALASPLVCGISIATRPDCLPKEVLALLASLKASFPEKFIWIELGLQTIHEETAAFIRRGYELPCFEDAVRTLRTLDIPVVIHVILGLPGEDKPKMLQTIEYLNQIRPFGVKLQLLHILEGTDLARHYADGEFEALTKDAYLDILIDCLKHLSPGIVVHRVTGDGPKRILIAPKWSCDKRDVLNSLHRRMQESHCFQGDCFTAADRKETLCCKSR